MQLSYLAAGERQSEFDPRLDAQRFTHNGRDDRRRIRGEQLLLDKTVPVVERFHQSPLLPGALQTENHSVIDGSKRTNRDANRFRVRLVLPVVRAGSQSRADISADWPSPLSAGNGTPPAHTGT